MRTHTSLVTISGYYTLTFSGNNTYSLKTWLNILGFVVDFCTVGSCEFMCTCQHGAATGRPLCIYFWPAAGSSSLTGVCLCERVSEVTSVGIHVFTQYFVFSAVAVLPHSCSVGHWGCSAQPWPTYLFLGGCPLAWISFRIFDSGICHFWVKYTTVYIDETWYVWIWPLFAQVMVVFRGKLHFFFPLSESRNNRQPDEERALHFQSLSAVWLMNYGWGYRLFSSGLLHWPTLNSIQIWSETSWEILSYFPPFFLVPISQEESKNHPRQQKYHMLYLDGWCLMCSMLTYQLFSGSLFSLSLFAILPWVIFNRVGWVICLLDLITLPPSCD